MVYLHDDILLYCAVEHFAVQRCRACRTESFHVIRRVARLCTTAINHDDDRLSKRSVVQRPTTLYDALHDAVYQL